MGRAGVAVDTIDDMETLFSGIDLGTVQHLDDDQLTCRGHHGHVRRRGRPDGCGSGRPLGTIQNDILKEYQAQKEFVFPPRPSVRLVTDVMRFATAELPRWHPVSISGYHIREAGSTAAQELAFTLANGFAYVEAARGRRAGRRRLRPAAELLLQRPHGLLRGDRQVPGRPPHLGPLDARPLRRHRRPLPPAALPHPDRRGVADRPAARGEPGPRGHRGPGRACSAEPRACTPTPSTRPWPCPTEHAARLALRTQQVIAEETGWSMWPTRWAAPGSSRR